MNKSTCLLCFAVNRRTLDIINTHLQQVFEQIAGFKIKDGSHPLCFICHTRLRQSYQLWQMVQQTQNVLQSLQQNVHKLPIKLESRRSLVELSMANVLNVSILFENEEIKQEQEVKKEEPVEKIDGMTSDVYRSRSRMCEISSNVELDEVDHNDEFEVEESTRGSGSDSEDDVPLNSIRMKQELETGEGTKTEVDTEHLKGVSVKSDVANSFREVTLSMEEQMREFLQRAKSVNYLCSPYRCELCYRGFVDPAAYDKHREKHDERAGSQECGICHLRYATARQLRAHTAAAHARRYLCDRCPHRAHTRNQAKEHEKWHGGHTYMCNLCGLKFTKPTTYLTHQRKRHSGENMCGKCGESFASRHGLMLHLSKSHKREPQPQQPEPAAERYCADCGQQFDSVSAWKRHLLTSNRHSLWKDGDECYICSQRVSKASRKSHARAHLRELGPKRGNAPPLQLACDQCGAYATSKSNLRAHVRRVHLGVKYNKNLVCEVCGKKCTSNATLRYHQRRHTGERPFACDCGARFADSNQLRIHRRVHSGERPYACALCAKRFSQKPALNKHYRVHTGAKPYECQFCKRSFSQTNSLKLHVRSVHLKLPPNNRKKNQDKIKKDNTEINN